MTRDDALKAAWVAWHGNIDPMFIPDTPTSQFRIGFCAGWDARPSPTLLPVIEWLERGGDPLKAADEMRIYQLLRDGA